MPITLISAAINQAFYPKAARELKSGNLEPFVLRVLKLLIIATTPIMVLFIYNAELICEVIFGSAWRDAGKYAVWLAFPGLMIVFTSWLDRIYDVLGRQRLALTVEISYDIVSLGLFTIAVVFLKNVEWGVAAYCVVTSIYNIIWLGITFYISKFSFHGLKKLGIMLVGIFFSASMIYWVTNLMVQRVYSIMIYIGLVIILYYYMGTQIIKNKE
jgi:O-antigen/teichoic acid export membrane protein